jgi:hypothetical protein
VVPVKNKKSHFTSSIPYTSMMIEWFKAGVLPQNVLVPERGRAKVF